MEGTWIWILTGLVYCLTLLEVIWVLLTKKQNPASTVAWIMIIVAIPIAGGILFLLFGVNRVNRKLARKQAASERIQRTFPERAQFNVLSGELRDHDLERLMKVAKRVSGTVPTVGNRVELLTNTHRAMGLIEQAILEAQHFIHLEYYIWHPDETGMRVRDLLIQRAKEGVQVRLLVDGFGSLFLSKKFLTPMRDVGINVSSFLPSRSMRSRLSFNLRNHRKIIVVDGKIGFTGGMNIGDEYLGLDEHLGYWRDTHLKLQGPAVAELHQIFLEDWYYATGQELDPDVMFPEMDEKGNIIAQIIPDGPTGDFDAFYALMFAAINEADNTVQLQTSFFVPPPGLVTALENAALRGVQVRLLVASRRGPHSPHWVTVLAGRSDYDVLLEAGVEIHEYSEGLLHAKTLTIDGKWSLVGSANFDPRSLFLNFEAGMVIYDTRIATQLEEAFEHDLEKSERIDPERWANRTRRQRLIENICRLFSPIL